MRDGFLLIDKDAGLTSRKVCNQISHILNEKKIGHIGTLDPFATGLLIVCVNKATKAGAYVDDGNKTYFAKIKLGEETDTLDTEGTIIKRSDVPKLSTEKIKEVLMSFMGESYQIPPMTSAIHVDGKRLYELAHQGIEINREPRKINVFSIKLVDYKDLSLSIEVSVSKGTYIRSLGSDIAKALGTIGYLTELRRIAVGPFTVKDAISLNDVSSDKLINIFDILSKVCPILTVDQQKAEDIKNGKIPFIESKEEKLLVVSDKKDVIAIYNRDEDGNLKFTRGLF